MGRIFKMLMVVILIGLGLLGLYLYFSWKDAKNIVTNKQTTIENIYVTAVTNGAISVYEEGKEKTYALAGEVDGEINSGIANLELTNEVVTKVYTKPDVVTGKVMTVEEDGIEIENYGKIPFSKNMKTYYLDGSIRMGAVSEIVVGYSNVRFVVVGGEIHGAIIERKEPPQVIRVLLMTDNFASYEHEKVEVTANRAFSVSQGDDRKDYAKGDKVCIEGNLRSKVEVSDGGKIKILSMKRHNRNPSYSGTIEVKKSESGYRIINELPLENYLYSVVPSEMPTSYGREALKAQAVCARSYGYQQVFANKLRKYGAHVDDSVSFQVYNNAPADKKSRQAVDETRGQVVMSGDSVATTYFYSTSCGSGASAKDVWYTKNEVPYLVGNTTEDFSSDAAFEQFLNADRADYEKEVPWYRWNVTISAESLKKSVENSLQKRYEINPSHVQVKKGDQFVSEKVKTIGKIKSIQVVKRGKSGIATAIEIKGSKKTVRIYSEYNIRLLLVGNGEKIKRKDGSEIGGLNLLPSAFFIVKKEKDQFVFSGGGFGHGVGMSQCGARAMAAAGKNYAEIISAYYPSTTFLTIY